MDVHQKRNTGVSREKLEQTESKKSSDESALEVGRERERQRKSERAKEERKCERKLRDISDKGILGPRGKSWSAPHRPPVVPPHCLTLVIYILL